MSVKPLLFAAVAAVFGGSSSALAASTAGEVLSHNFGTGGHASYVNVNNALGETSRNTGYGWSGSPPPLFLSNPYNNPWRTQDWVAIGKGGHITLKLEHFAEEQADAPELNVLVFQQLTTAGQPWYSRQASVSVSKNGVDWFSLNGGGVIDFNTPATGYVFPGTIPQDQFGGFGAINEADLGLYTESDYGLPMPGSINFGAGAEASRAAAYGLSGGGNWLDFSSTGLDKVGFIRFDVATNAPQYFALDAVYLNNDAIGALVPEPAALSLLALGGVGLLARRR